MNIRAGNYCCSTDQEPVVYIEDQYSEGSLSSSLVILTMSRSLTMDLIFIFIFLLFFYF